MKQTAVEWLVEEFKEKLTGNNLPNWVLDVIQQAKEMEGKQIINAYDQGCEAGYELAKNDDFIEGFQVKEGKEYYNATFKSE